MIMLIQDEEALQKKEIGRMGEICRLERVEEVATVSLARGEEAGVTGEVIIASSDVCQELQSTVLPAREIADNDAR